MADRDRSDATRRGFGRTTAAVMPSRPTPAEGLPSVGIARGAGCSYGDQSLCHGGTAWRAPTGITFDGDDLLVGGGVRLRDVLATVWPRGRTLPVVPGSLAVTVGGAIAADVHGKNHLHAGSFGQHVRDLELVSPTGTHRLVEQDDGFRATVGGMGLTGVVRHARLATVPLDSAWVSHRTLRVVGFDALLDLLDDTARDHAHAAAWIDLAGGRIRAIVEGSDPAAPPDGAARFPLPTPPRLAVPPLPVSAVGRWTVRLGNEARWRATPDRDRTIPLARAITPLETLEQFPRAYGPAGMVQHQVFLPATERELLATVLSTHRDAPTVPALVVLKRLGGRGPGHLSFPGDGWTVATDFPAGDRDLGVVLDDLDRVVAAAGGRVYLAKDAVLQAGTAATMYPQLPAWRAVADRLDPDHLVTSDLDRRLGLRRPRAAVTADPGTRRGDA